MDGNTPQKGKARGPSPERETTVARGRACKRCGADEWRRTLFGRLARRVWLLLALPGLGMMFLSLFTAWSSITAGTALLILGTAGLLSRPWQCTACKRPFWKKTVSAALTAGKLAVLALLITGVAFLGFYRFGQDIPTIDRAFRYLISRDLGKWYMGQGKREKAFYWFTKVLESTENNSPGMSDAYAYVSLNLEDTAKALDQEGAEDSLDHLAQALNHEKTWMRCAAVLALSWKDSPEAVDHLTVALKDGSGMVRAFAASAFAWIGTKEPVPDIILALQDPSPLVRSKAAETLGLIGPWSDVKPRLIQALKDDSMDVRASAVYALSWMPSPDLAPRFIGLIRDLEDRNRPRKQLQYDAILALGRTGSPEALPFLLGLIQGKKAQDYWARKGAADALGRTGSPKAVPHLITALKDDHPEVRKAAARALGKTGDPGAVPFLIEALATTAPGEKGWGPASKRNAIKGKKGGGRRGPVTSRPEAARALGEIGSPKAVPALIEALKDPDPRVRQSAVWALARIRAPGAIPHLMTALEDGSPRVRQEAADALGRAGTPDAVSRLLEVLKDKYAGSDAAEALGRIGSPQVVPRLIEALKFENSRSGAVRALGRIGDPLSIRPLIQALEDQEDHVRKDAARALGAMGAPEAVPHLIRTLIHDQQDWVRLHAGYALSGKLFPHVPFHRIAEQADHFIPALHETEDYSANLAAVTYFASGSASYRTRLRLLKTIFRRDVRKDDVTPDTVLKNFRSLEAGDPGGRAERGYAYFFAAYLLKERASFREALEWTEKALTLRSGKKDIPLRIALKWLKAESLLRLDRPAEALHEVNDIEEHLLPGVSVFDRNHTYLPYDAYTAGLKGILLNSLGKSRESLLCLYDAEEKLKRERRVSEDTRKRIEKILLSFRAKAQGRAEKDDADRAIRISEDLPARTSLEMDAEETALGTRIQAAVGEGDYETAHKLMEKLALRKTAHITSRGLLVASPAKKRTFETFKNLEGEVRELTRAIARAESQNGDEGSSGGPAGLRGESGNQGSDRDIETLKRKRRERQRALKKFFVDLKRNRPEMATMVGAEPIEMSVLQDKISGTQAILQYLVLADRSYIFLITRGDIKIWESSLDQRTLTQSVRQFRRAIMDEASGTGESARSRRRELGRSLSRALIEPVLPDLERYEHLIIIPNGDLHFLPFGVLNPGDTFLAERFTLSYLSASSLLAVVTRSSSDERKLLAIANPANPDFSILAGAEREVERISAFFSEKQVFLREKARKDILLDRDLRGLHLHLSMHGEAGRYENTRLILSDGDLTVSDIWGLYLDGSPLVVLSACETHLGERISGDEIVSLANGFIFAGAASVVSSLWKVSDLHTVELMTLFYEYMNEGMGKAQALALAKRELIRGKRFAPFFWGAFVINGL